VLVYLLVVSRRDVRSLAAPAGWLLLGALPLVALTAVLNQHLMGSPLSFPQNVAGSLNKFGFGDRLGIHDPGTRAALPIHFTLGKSWSALWKDVRLMPRWVFGSYVAVALAIFSMVRRRRDPRAWLLFAFVVVFPFGYLFWWGNYSATFVFRLELGLGPYYYFPAIAAIGLLAADGIVLLLDALARVTARAAAFGLLGGLALLMVAVTAIGMRYPLKDASRLRRQERAALARVAPVPRNGLLFLTQDQIGNPYPELVNAPDLSNSPLYALDRVDRNLALIDRYPSKPPYALRYAFGYDVDIFKHRPRPKLVAVHVVPTFERPVTATFHTPSPKRYVIAYVRQGDRVVSRVLDTAAVPGRSYVASWDVKSPAAGSSGTGGFVVTPTSGDAYAVGFATSNTPSLAGADRYEYRWAFSARPAGPMRVAEPAAPYRDLVFPNNVDVWVMEDVSPVLTVSGAGSPR
jgi:hypothetical protein